MHNEVCSTEITPKLFLNCRRIADNVLELVEESLDTNLRGNSLKVQFLDGIILPMLHIFETYSHVIVLAATTNSVHRIIFTHPERLQRHVRLFEVIWFLTNQLFKMLIVLLME